MAACGVAVPDGEEFVDLVHEEFAGRYVGVGAGGVESGVVDPGGPVEEVVVGGVVPGGQVGAVLPGGQDDFESA